MNKKVTYGAVWQQEFHRGWPDTMVPSVKRPSQIVKGEFVIPQKSDATSFFFDAYFPGRFGGKASEDIRTGIIYPDAELYDLQEAKFNFLQPQLFEKAEKQNAKYIVKTRSGRLEVFNQNDVIVTGGDQKWRLRQKHPDAPAELTKAQELWMPSL